MLDPACPWSSFAPASSRFCEDALCGWIREPANTWSNVGFLIAGVAILTRSPALVPRLVRRFGWACIFLAVGSAAFHASRTFAGGLLDTAGMQAAAAFMLAANIRRVFPARDTASQDRRDRRTFWIIAALGVAFAVGFEAHERSIFALEMVIAGALEIVVVRRSRLQRAHRWLALSWGTFIPAYAAWWLDVHRIVCDSAAHVWNGHATWHLLMAASLYFVQRFHAELGSRDVRARPEQGSGNAMREPQSEARAAPDLGVERDAAAVPLHGRVHHREA